MWQQFSELDGDQNRHISSPRISPSIIYCEGLLAKGAQGFEKLPGVDF
jgi:hypothetical protein